MKWIDSIILVLIFEKKGVHFKEISNRILTQNLTKTQSESPEKVILNIISKNLKKKLNSVFIRHGKGVYRLNTKAVQKHFSKEMLHYTIPKVESLWVTPTLKIDFEINFSDKKVTSNKQ